VSGIRSFFEPRSIAVAGVSEDPNKLGSIIFANLVDNSKKGLLGANVYALNPERDRIGDQPCYPSIGELPEVPELLIVAVPESQTVELIRAAGKCGVKASVIITGGYAEVGRGGVQREIGRLAAKHGMRVLGPNTIGLVDTRSGVDSLFLRPTKTLPDGRQIVSMLRPLKGEVTIVTQSGHLGEAVAEELAANEVGIRALVGTGNQLDVSVEDMIRYFADDPHTRVIAVYLEGLRDGRRFMKAATEAVRKKPLVVFKVGKTSVGERAALTHTASLVGDYQVYRAALRQAGVIEADTLQELVDYSISLLMLPRVAGRRTVIVTNAGGVGAIAADMAAELGLRVDPPGTEARKKLLSEIQDATLVSNASLGNPIDLTASATTSEFVRVVKLVTTLPEYDLVLVLPTHQAPGIDCDIAERLGEAVSKTRKLVVSCVIGNSELAERLHREFMERGIPSFPTPERAVRALAVASEYARSRRAVRGPGVILRRTLRGFGHRKGPLAPKEVSSLLRSHGIDEPKSVVIESSRDFARLRRFRFPVACKLLSKGLLHKTDLGGVVVDVPDGAEAERVFRRFEKLTARKGLPFEGMLVQEMVPRGVELLLGGMRDPTFGPVIVLGFGGAYAEVIRDYSLAVAPVTPLEVRRMLIGEKLGLVLGGYRGGPRVNTGRLSKLVSSFSRIMVENPQIEQMEVNPLMATDRTILSVDARVLLG
jgi:acetyltransferase